MSHRTRFERLLRVIQKGAVLRGVFLGVAGVLTLGCQPSAQTPITSTTESAENSAATHEWPAKSWLRWGGVDGRMFAAERAWSDDWSTSVPQVLWTVEIGTGFSSVTVQDGRLFTMGRVDEDDLIVAIDAKSGTEIWRDRYPVPLFDNLHEGGPGSTPTLVEDSLLTVSRNGICKRLKQATGEVQWEANLVELTGIEAPEWGLTTSALVLGDRVYYEAGSLVALDLATGAMIWKSEGAKPGYGSPAPMTFNGEEFLVTMNNEAVRVVRQNDGVIVASQPWTTQFDTSAATPLVNGDTIFVSTGYDTGCALFRLTTDLQLNEVYRHKSMRNHMNACVLVNETLYGVDGNSHNPRTCRLVALDFNSGEELWAHREFGCGSVLGIADSLLVLSDDGTLVALDASREGYQEKSRYPILEGRCWTVPTVIDRVVYARNAGGTLVAVELPAKN